MIVDYDHNPSIDGEKRLQSLKESVQRALDEVSNTDEKTTTIVQKVFELMNGRIWKECYPVGSIYLSVNSTDPSTLFGGSWERIQDRFLLASGNSYGAGSTGGSADAVVVKHLHQPSTGEGFNAYMNGVVERARVGTSTASSSRYAIVGKKNASSADASGLRFAGSTDWTGSDGAGKNMPPYLAVYVWKRTA